MQICVFMSVSCNIYWQTCSKYFLYSFEYFSTNDIHYNNQLEQTTLLVFILILIWLNSTNQHTLVESLNNLLKLLCFSIYTFNFSIASSCVCIWYHTQMVKIPSISNIIKAFNVYQLWKLLDDSSLIQLYSNRFAHV